jgi:hypothetical protein
MTEIAVLVRREWRPWISIETTEFNPRDPSVPATLGRLLQPFRCQAAAARRGYAPCVRDERKRREARLWRPVYQSRSPGKRELRGPRHHEALAEETDSSSPLGAWQSVWTSVRLGLSWASPTVSQ